MVKPVSAERTDNKAGGGKACPVDHDPAQITASERQPAVDCATRGRVTGGVFVNMKVDAH
jgi:hypothetical protein